MQPIYTRWPGEWPQRAFVEGVVWWQHHTNGSMDSDMYHEAALEAVRRYMHPGYCEWSLDDDSYDTSCGEKHLFIAGDIADNSYKFCPYCGNLVTTFPADTAED